MKRFFKELRNPILKCVRVGHKEAVRNYSGYETTRSWSDVADAVSGKITYCTRGVYGAKATVTHYEAK